MQRETENLNNQHRIINIPEMFNHSAEKYAENRCQWFQPDKTKPVITEQLSYMDISRKIHELSAGLLSIGLQPHDKAFILAENCPQWLWCDLAVMNNRSVTVSLFPSASNDEIKYVLTQTNCSIIFVQNNHILNSIKMLLNELPALKKAIIMCDLEIPHFDEKFMTLNQLIETGKTYLACSPFALQHLSKELKGTDSAAILYSKDIFNPKVYSHNCFLNSIFDYCALFQQQGFLLDQQDVLLSFLPPAIPDERIGQLITLFTGGTIAYPDQSTSFLRDFNIYHPTWFYALPEHYEKVFLAMQDAYAWMPEGKAMFEIAVETGLEALKTKTELAAPGLSMTDELTEKLSWADEKIFSRFRILFGDRFRFSVCTAPGLPADLADIYESMSLMIFNSLMQT